MPLPHALAWAVGIAGAAALGKLVMKEWQRVNDALHPREAAVPVRERAVRERLPKLRQDPRTGIYRPE